MDFCRNVSVSNGLPAEYPSEQVISPAYSKHNGTNYNSASLDDLFPIQNTEGDVSLEWLSAFVEDCLSSTGNCIPAAAPTTTLDQAANNPKPKPTKTTTTTITQIIPKPIENFQKTLPSLQIQKFSIPGKARSKRRRSSSITNTPHHHLHKKIQTFHVISSDPPLLHQAYWLADSELILPKKMDNNNTSSGDDDEEEEEEEEEINEEEEKMMMGGGDNNKDNLLGSSIESSYGQPRRCTHCLSQRTPQWRAGPLGPKTLCNACGVRFKSGRLLPEYRPAKSPTFVSYKHSNSHKKVMEMRMSVSSTPN